MLFLQQSHTYFDKATISATPYETMEAIFIQTTAPYIIVSNYFSQNK